MDIQPKKFANAFKIIALLLPCRFLNDDQSNRSADRLFGFLALYPTGHWLLVFPQESGD